ncbi:MAG TPA: hypothetical protein VIK33_02890 [Anaerolineae bacterium]
MISTDFERAVREAFADLNRDMIAVLANLSPERRFAMIGELADFARAAYVAQEQRAHPNLPPEEIRLRAVERMLLRGGVRPEIVRKVCRRAG